jgi:hypothetical protein
MSQWESVKLQDIDHKQAKTTEMLNMRIRAEKKYRNAEEHVVRQRDVARSAFARDQGETTAVEGENIQFHSDPLSVTRECTARKL